MTSLTRQPVDTSVVDELVGDHGGPRLVFVNGRFADELSRTEPVADGVRVLSEAQGDAGEGDVAVITVDPRSSSALPVHVVHLSLPDDSQHAFQPRTRIQLGASSVTTVIESYAGLAGPVEAEALTDAATTIVAEHGAELTHYRVQTEALGLTHLSNTHITQAGGSTVRSCAITAGGDIARNQVQVVLAGPHAHSELQGLYLPTGTQDHASTTTVQHAASSCTSSQLYKGAIDDRGKGTFAGRIVVDHGTKGTDATQTSRSLLLQRTAQADAQPWLEIFADDVKCSHGATVGQLDDEALFYLRTRGIAEVDARALLIDAFIHEIIDTIGPRTLRAHVVDSLAGVTSQSLEDEA